VLQTLSWLPRTEGAARLSFARRGEQTQLDVLYQAGAARVRFPRPTAGAPREAVLLNTAGGLTGGDHMSLDVTLGARAEATLTTAAAEKICRARDGDATIAVTLALGAGARLAWLPQATILFDGSRLDRRTEVQLAGDARFLGVEFLIFGRQARGRTCTSAPVATPGASGATAPWFLPTRSALAAPLPARWTGRPRSLARAPRSCSSMSRPTRLLVSRPCAPCWRGWKAWRGQARGTACWSCVRSPMTRTLQGDIAPVAQALSGGRCRAYGSAEGDCVLRECP
jgi:hypothetical protein